MKRTVTVRMPDELHDRCRKTAKKRNVSMNELFLESLTAMLDSAEQKALYDAFGRVASGSDVSFAHKAQKEVLEDE
jgi:predicted transcriptional regulator